MNKLFYLIAILLLSNFMGCDELKDENRSNINGPLRSFVIYTTNAEYHANVDNNLYLLSISGLEYSSDITNVSVQLYEDYKLSTKLSAESDWQTEQKIVITHKYGQEYSYTLKLPDLKQKINDNFVVMGYITPSRISFDVLFPKINLNHLTHLLACFAKVNSDGSLDLTGLAKMDQLIRAAKSHNIKILVSVRDKANDSFTEAIKKPESRTKLVTQILNYVQANNLDGFDIDFEDYSYINTSVGRSNLLAFAKELREAKPTDVLMTCAVSPFPNYSDQWAQYYDYINIMSYDAFSGKQHATYDSYVRHISKVQESMNVPIWKLVGGIPFYGYSDDNIPGKDANRAIGYGAVVKHFGGSAVADRDNISETYYNGRPTIRNKCEYAKTKGLGGVMIWELLMDTDEPEYKLLDVIGEEMLFEQ